MRSWLVVWTEGRNSFVSVKANSLNRFVLRRKMPLIALGGCVHRHAISNPESSSLARLGRCSGVPFPPQHHPSVQHHEAITKRFHVLITDGCNTVENYMNVSSTPLSSESDPIRLGAPASIIHRCSDHQTTSPAQAQNAIMSSVLLECARVRFVLMVCASFVHVKHECLYRATLYGLLKPPSVVSNALSFKLSDWSYY